MTPQHFTAAAPALGYVAQIEWALLLALKKFNTPDVGLKMSLETVDDIAFDADDASSRELVQVKNQTKRRGILTDGSRDLWKTLHNWIRIAGNESSCVLLTTALAPCGVS